MRTTILENPVILKNNIEYKTTKEFVLQRVKEVLGFVKDLLIVGVSLTSLIAIIFVALRLAAKLAIFLI